MSTGQALGTTIHEKEKDSDTVLTMMQSNADFSRALAEQVEIKAQRICGLPPEAKGEGGPKLAYTDCFSGSLRRISDDIAESQKRIERALGALDKFI